MELLNYRQEKIRILTFLAQNECNNRRMAGESKTYVLPKLLHVHQFTFFRRSFQIQGPVS